MSYSSLLARCIQIIAVSSTTVDAATLSSFGDWLSQFLEGASTVDQGDLEQFIGDRMTSIQVMACNGTPDVINTDDNNATEIQRVELGVGSELIEAKVIPIHEEAGSVLDKLNAILKQLAVFYMHVKQFDVTSDWVVERYKSLAEDFLKTQRRDDTDVLSISIQR